jgi:hypothetical protein
MINYTWTVTEMDAYTQLETYDNVVFSVSWQLTGSQTNSDSTVTTGSAIGVTVVPEPSNPDGSFTPYADLTEDQVIGWVQAVLGPDVISRYEQNIADQIAEQLGPAVVTPPLPWIPEPDPVPPEPTPDPTPPIPGPPVPGE